MTFQNNNNYYASSTLIDYGNDPSKPPVLAEAELIPYSYSENEKSYTSSVTTYEYTAPHGTTPTNAVVPYDAEQGNNYNVNAVQNEARSVKTRRRRRRRVRMAAAGVTGAVVGGIALGPLGAAAGGVGAAAATRAVSKLGEKRKDRRVERERVAHQSMSGNAPIVNAVSC